MIRHSTYYELGHEFHGESNNIGIFTQTDNFYHNVNFPDLKQYAWADNPKSPENLNYNLNIHTQLYQLYLRLKRYADKIGYSNEHFVFPAQSLKNK
jgi:hypothetical protein